MRTREWFGVSLVGAVSLLGGCAGFFPSTSSTTVATATSGDYLYVVNQSTNTLSEFSVGSSALAVISGSPISLSSVIASGSAASIAVTRQNTFVYVGGQGGIGCFSIGTGGALTAVSAGNIVTTGDIVSLDTSYDGKWLVALDNVLHAITVYTINTSTGALSVAAGSPVSYPLTINSNISLAEAVRVAPNNSYIAVALGTAGDILYPFTTSTGLLSAGQLIGFSTAGNTTVSDNALAFDTSSGYLYVARGVAGSGKSLVASYSISSAGVPSTVQTVTTGDTPYAVLVDSTDKYLYTANRGSGSVSGYTISNGTFTALSGSPYSSGTTSTALVEDNTAKYVIAAALGGSNDYTLYSFDALIAGKLDAAAVGASGSDPAGAIAVAATH